MVVMLVHYLYGLWKVLKKHGRTKTKTKKQSNKKHHYCELYSRWENCKKDVNN